MAHHAVQRLLRRPQRERRVLEERARHLHRPFVQALLAGDLVQQPGGAHLLRIHQPGEEEDVLGSGDPDQRREASVVSHRERVAERARDRKAEPGGGSAEPQIAGCRDARAAAGARALDGGDGGYRDVFQRVEDAVHHRLVTYGVLGRLEAAELCDVGPGHERLVACAAQDQHLHPRIRRPADLAQALVHPERHRVARLGSVEGEPGDAVVADLEQDLFRAHAGSRITPALASLSISSSE